MILTRAPEVDHRAALRRLAPAGTARRRAARLERAAVGAGGEEQSRATFWSATSSSSRDRGSSWRPIASRARCTQKRFDDQVSGFVVERQGQRVDGARRCGSDGDVELGGLLTTINEPTQRVAMHAVRVDVLRGAGRGARTAAVDWCRFRRRARTRSTKSAMRGVVARARRRRVHARRVRRSVSRGHPPLPRGALAGTGLTPLFPLFATRHRHAALAREMIAAGLRARITCLNPRDSIAAFAGREFDRTLLDDLPATVDPCGERGEFHTCAYAGRCSATRSRSRPASPSSATASSSRTYAEPDV